jgi:hypothetical protein
MTCKSCDEKNNRYASTAKPMEERRPVLQAPPPLSALDKERSLEVSRDKAAGVVPDKSPLPPPPIDPIAQIEKMNDLSFDELTTSKKSFQESMRENSLQNIRKMSPAVRKSYFEELVEIANCVGFTPMGISPDQAIVELNRLINMDEFSFVKEDYPLARFKIEERYSHILMNRITLLKI